MNSVAAAAMLAIAAYCAVRVVASLWLPSEHLAGSVMHGVMAVVMAGMYVPRLTVPVPVVALRTAFAGFALAALVAWYRHRRRDGSRRDAVTSCTHRDHALASAAMLYMLVPRTRVPAPVDQLLVVCFTAALVVVAVQWSARTIACARDLVTTRPRPRLRGWFVAPLGPMGCDAAMATVMAVMIYTGG
jgi:hypothetical protein